MRLFISFITSISLFLISGCSKATIKTSERNQLLISNGETVIKVATADIETSCKNMSMIYIDEI